MEEDATRARGHTVPLSAVVGRRDLGLSTVVAAGDPGVGWAVVSELTDPAAYLRGGELLLTAGVDLPSGAAGLRDYVDNLADAGVSALGFGVTPVHDTVPAGLVERCRARGLPLVEVPRSTPFAAVSQAVGAELEELHLRDLRRIGEAHQALALAVTDPAPTDRVLRVLAQSLGGWAALARPTGPASEDVVRTPGAPSRLDPELHGLVDRLTRPRGPRSAKAGAGGDEVFLHTVGTPPEDHGVLLVGRPAPLGLTDRAVLRTASALLELVSRTARRTRAAPGRLITGLLLEGRLTEEALPLLGELAGPGREAPDGDAYRVLLALPVEQGRHDLPAAPPLDTLLLEADPGRLRAVLADRGERAHAEHLERLLEQGWLGALSRPVPPGELSAAQDRTAVLFARARASGRPLVEERADPFDVLLGSRSGAALARQTLGRLAEDTDAARVLRRTLRVWLTRHGNWDRSAADLGAHRNSVRYRIGRIERELGVDLADAEQRMRLWFALTRWDGG